MSKKRKTYFQAVVMELECGHIAEIRTSFYKLWKTRAICIYSHYIRSGCLCQKCQAICQPVKYLGVKSMKE